MGPRRSHGRLTLTVLCVAACGCRRAPVNPVEREPQRSAATVAKASCDQPCALNQICANGSCPRYPRLVTRSLTSCLIAHEGSAKCWTMIEPGKPPIVRALPAEVTPLLALDGDSASTCALSREQHLHCWGERWGRAFREPTKLPIASLPANLTVRQFSNHYTVCALLSDDSLRCTKLSSEDAPLQFSSSVSFEADPAIGVAAGLITCVLRRSGAVKCFGDAVSREFDTQGKDVALSGRALALAVGSRHACALLESGHVACWGDNGRGQLGRGHDFWSGNLPLADGPFEIPLGTTAKVVGITAGDDHTCAWFADGRFKCWGANGEGQLGLGDLNDRGSHPDQMGAALPFVDLGAGARVLSVDAGPSTTCALLADQRVKCWGWGYTPPDVNAQTATGDKITPLAL